MHAGLKVDQTLIKPDMECPSRLKLPNLELQLQPSCSGGTVCNSNCFYPQTSRPFKTNWRLGTEKVTKGECATVFTAECLINVKITFTVNTSGFHRIAVHSSLGNSNQ